MTEEVFRVPSELTRSMVLKYLHSSATGDRATRGGFTSRLVNEIRVVQGLTYNIGRVASAAAPYVVGGLTATHGYGAALSVAAAAFALAAVFWLFIPETRGRSIA